MFLHVFHANFLIKSSSAEIEITKFLAMLRERDLRHRIFIANIYQTSG